MCKNIWNPSIGSPDSATDCSMILNGQIRAMFDASVLELRYQKRLVYMINNEEVSMKNVEWLIVDESDKLFETTGKGDTSFRDQLATIYRYVILDHFYSIILHTLGAVMFN